MNNCYKWILGVMAVAALVAPKASAGEGTKLLTVENTFGGEYDDNIYQTKDNKEASFKLSDSISLSLDRTAETSFASLRYRLTGVWWDNRPSNDFDVNHVFDLVWSQRLSRRLNLEVSDSFIYADLPELRSDNMVVRDQNSYAYNTVNATLGTQLSNTTRLDVSGRNIILRYDKEPYSKTEDYNIWVAGLTLRNQAQPKTSIFADARYEFLDYIHAGETASSVDMPGYTGAPVTTVPDRGANSYQGGLGVEQTFSPKFMGSLSAGGTMRDYADANSGSDSAPYVDGTVTVVPAQDLRLSLNVAYSLYQSALSTYAGQQSTRATLGLGYDLTTKISLNLSATYLHSDYQAKSSVSTIDENQVADGTEDALIFGTSLGYNVDKRNRIQVGYDFTDLSSDLRPDYQRNRYSAGWTIRL